MCLIHWDQAVPLVFFSALHGRNILVFNFYFKHVEEMLLKISKYDCDSRIVRVFSTSQNIRDIISIPISMSLAFLLCKCKQRTCHSSTSVFELQQNIFNFYQKLTYDFNLESSQSSESFIGGMAMKPKVNVTCWNSGGKEMIEQCVMSSKECDS